MRVFRGQATQILRRPAMRKFAHMGNVFEDSTNISRKSLKFIPRVAIRYPQYSLLSGELWWAVAISMLELRNESGELKISFYARRMRVFWRRTERIIGQSSRVPMSARIV